MKILNANIKEFGCFENRSFDLSEGFNLITGDNESGKSTLLSFIKFILYGMPRKSQETAAERDRSISMKSGHASGSLRICLDDGKIYTVERRGILRSGEKRESYSEECVIIDEESGAPVHKGEIPGELFLGVPAAVFESTCFVRQMKTTEMNSEEIGDLLSNILISADESIDLQRSLDKLDSLRKTLLHKNGKGGTLAALSDEIDSLSMRLDRAKADSERIISYNDSVHQLKKSAAARRHELDRLDDTFTSFNSAAIIKRFETLHECEKNAQALSERIASLDGDYTRDGVLPTRELSATAEASAKHYSTALNARDAANQRLERALSAKRDFKKRYPDLTADEIRSAGGLEGICSSLESISKSAWGKRRLSFVFAAIAIASAVGGAALAVLLSSLIIAAIGLCALSVLTIGTSVALSVSAKKSRSTRASMLERYGISADGEIFDLRACLSAVFEDELTEKELENALSLARSGAELRHSDLEVANADADRVLGSWKISSSSTKPDALSEMAKAVRDYYTARDELSRLLDLENGRAKTLRQELSAYNEADLRARINPAILEGYDQNAADELERRRKFCQTALRSINEKQISAERELIRLESESENPSRVAILLEEARARYAEEKFKYDSAVAAFEALSAASANIRDSVTPVIRQKAAEYLSKFTDGRYSSLGLENGFVPVAVEGGGTRARPELLSAGTRDAMYLSLRLSLLSVLYRDRIPPIILDEALSQMDDTRAENALAILADFCADGGQCLLFTCHGRERSLLSNRTNAAHTAL